MHYDYVLITPALNESAFIERTVQSVVAQTRLPKRWVIVSDGSTDDTDRIVEKYLCDYDWLQLVKLPPRATRNFAAKVHAFNAGYERVEDLSFDIVGNLDADVSCEADYFEYLLQQFESSPELGVAGTHYVEGAFHSFRDSYINEKHVNGQCQLFRRTCYADIGGYQPIPGGGIDWVAVTTARMRGWTTRSFTDRTFVHHRKMGTAQTSELGARFHYGKKDYFLGGHPLWQLCRGVFQMGKKPYVLGGLSLLYGYFSCWMARKEKPISKELMDFHRSEQFARLQHLVLNFMRVDRQPAAIHIAAPSYAVGALFDATTLVRGQPQNIQCVDIGSKVFQLERGLLTTLHLEDEWFDDIDDPELVLKAIAGHSELRPDLFSFWQRLPDIEPKYDYHLEWQEIAVLPITSYDDWWEKKIKSRIRSQIRRAHKEGLVVKEVLYDDDFVRGMITIFNESPVRQGRPFWHFGKDFETVKTQFSRFVFRETLIGAYYDDELIGFIMLANAGRFGLTCQIISSLRHRDKSPNNALIAKAVEVSARLKLDYLVYLFWGDDSLTEFKRRCGFEMMRAPRYSVPLTWKGALALKYGMHHGVKEAIPAPIKHRLKAWRNAWYRRHSD